MPDEVPRAGDDREVGVGDLLREVLRDRAEVGLVVFSNHHERRDVQCRERCQLGPADGGLLVGGLELEGATLLWAHLVVVAGRDPEFEIDLGRRVEVAGFDCLLLTAAK